MHSIVYNTGCPGDGTQVFLEKMPPVLAQYPPPATAILSMGANDCINPRRSIPFPAFRKNYRQILKTLTDAGYQLITIVPPVIYFDEFLKKYPEMTEAYHNGLEDDYRKYVNAVRTISDEFKVPYLDIAEIFSAVNGTPEESFTRYKQNCGAFDGLHPTPHGHILIGALLCQMIRDLNYPTGHVLCLGDSLTHGYPLAGMGTIEGDNYPSAIHRILNGESAL